MGVHSVCISSSIAIPADKSGAALAALRKGIADLGFMDRRNIEFCSSLPEALEALDFEFEVVEGGIRQLHFGGGKGDNSVFVLPILAPFIADASRLVMEHDDEREIWEFSGGEYSRYIDDDDDRDHDEDEDISDVAYALFDSVDELDFGDGDVAAAVKVEGNLDFACGGDDDTVMIRFMAAVTGGSGDSVIVRTETPDGVQDKLDLLLKYQPDLNRVNYYGESALSMALQGGLFDVADQLIDHGADLFFDPAPNPFNLSALHRSKDLVQYLVDKGHAFVDHGDDALVLACSVREYEDGKLDFAKFLIDDVGLDVNQKSTKALGAQTGELRAGATPLMAAACSDDATVAAFLLERGADATATDSAGNTALHYCSGQTWYSGDGDMCWFADRGNQEVVKLLATDAKSIAAKNRSGQSPYTLARADNKKVLAIFREVLARDGVTAPVELTDDLNGEVAARADGQMGYVLTFRNGQLHGRQKFLNKNGNPFAEVDYVDGKAHGEYRCWHDNGELLLDAGLENGRWHGEIKLMTKEGKIGQHLNYKSGRRHGRQQLFNDDGSAIIDANYVDGKKHGHFYFKKPGGEVVVDEEFVDDAPKKAGEKKADKPKKEGLAGLFGALLGAISKEYVAAGMAEDMLKPTSKLFFHQQDKVFALFEKMQSRTLGEA